MIELSDCCYDIMSLAREHNCPVVIHDKPTRVVPFTGYYPGRTVRLILSQVTDVSPLEQQRYFERIFLHEVCHHLTWRQEWENASYYEEDGVWYSTSPTAYLCEYETESLCRQIAAENGWQHIIDESNAMLTGFVKRKIQADFQHYNKRAGDLWGWEYAAQRICKENGLTMVCEDSGTK